MVLTKKEKIELWSVADLKADLKKRGVETFRGKKVYQLKKADLVDAVLAKSPSPKKSSPRKSSPKRSPKKASSPKKSSPKKSSPKRSPKKASPKKASPKKSSPKKASPKKASSPKKSSPKKATSPKKESPKKKCAKELYVVLYNPRGSYMEGYIPNKKWYSTKAKATEAMMAEINERPTYEWKQEGDGWVGFENTIEVVSLTKG